VKRGPAGEIAGQETPARRRAHRRQVREDARRLGELREVDPVGPEHLEVDLALGISPR
jgi:hypothetical protein